MQQMKIEKNNRIVITGATGLVGSQLISLLIQSGYNNILAMRRETSSLELVEEFKDEIDWVTADIKDITSLGFLHAGDIIIHTAAVVSYASGMKHEMYDVNIGGTENIVNEALHAGVDKFIHISSVAALGSNNYDSKTTEQDIYDQNADNSPYSISKQFAERQVWRAQQEGLNTLILNPTIILGAGYWKSGSSAIIHRTAQGLPFYPKGSTGFVDVRDVAIACMKCFESDMSGERFILNGFNISYKEFFSILAEKLNVEMPSYALPDWLGGAFWRWEWLKAMFTPHPPVVSKHTVSAARKHKTYDNNKSIDMLGLDYTSLNKTLEDIVREFQRAKRENKDYGLLELKQ